jgi:hypothetical protein
MTTQSGEDLGHGVRVRPATGGEVIVISSGLDLRWRVAEGRAPGTAVIWQDRPFEVVARAGSGAGRYWTLRPWPEAVTIRAVLSLDAAAVSELAEHAAAAKRRRRGRLWLIVLLPMTGLAPARIVLVFADGGPPSLAVAFRRRRLLYGPVVRPRRRRDGVGR